MPLTFGQIRELVAPYVGRSGTCADAPEAATFARSVLKYLLYSGDQAAIRKICIIACKGCIVLPQEVETPLQVRIDHRVGQIWSKWLSYHASGGQLDGRGRCYPAGEILIEDGSYSPLAYSLPPGGSRIGVMGTCDEAQDAAVIIQGKDPTGRVVYTESPEGQVPGERLSIVKNEIRYGQVVFGEVTAVKKPITNGYVQCFAVNPPCEDKQFLVDWAPPEELPLYRVFKLISCDCPPLAHVSLLCRVRLKDNYHDKEVLFFDNEIAITFAAQRLQAETTNDLNVAGFKKQAVDNILDQEAGYKKISGQPLNVFQPLSGGAIKGIVGNFRGAFNRRGF
jgi:hypothetical protein